MTQFYDEIVQILRDNALAGVLPAHVAKMTLKPETRLSDLGIDSLGKMALLTALMDYTDKYLADDTFKDDQTLAEISEVIATA